MKFELDASVGLRDTPPHNHPQIWFLPDDPQPEGSTYGSNLAIRPADQSELQTFSENAQRKLNRLGLC